MDYSFLAGKRRTQEMDKWGEHLSVLENQVTARVCGAAEQLLLSAKR